MNQLPSELALHIFKFICPLNTHWLNKRMWAIMTCNDVWKPIVQNQYDICTSINFYEEYKWQKKKARYMKTYQRRWTCGCIGKIKPLGAKPVLKAPKTIWAH